jgi:uncharacterized protein YndB with AHSA1/START domain
LYNRGTKGRSGGALVNAQASMRGAPGTGVPGIGFVMAFIESIEIAARPEEVWPLIADPQQMAAWNEKLVSVNRRDVGPVRLGERFEAVYQMSGKRRETTVEVLRCQPPLALTLRHRMAGESAERFVDESYDLFAEGNATRVEQGVDFSHAGLPLWARALMWFVSTFGRPSGEGTLEPLKRACETEGQK